MSTAALSRSQSQPRAEAEVPNPRGPSGVSTTTAPQGNQAPGQEPGQPHLLTRPVFYLHAPPPPPFMPYQWPMPFYPPFNPFSGMGYGMMMPPFPPAPYMEPPAYFLPHAPVQPVDYRRMVHPQPHPNSAPYPAPTRRPRPPPASLVRETVNCEVQTDPRDGDFQTGCPFISCSDSGRGTAPSSPTSSTSSNPKNSYGSVESNSRAKEGSNLPITSTRGAVKPGLQMVNPGERKVVQEIVKENHLVNSPPLRSRNLPLMRQENVETVDTPVKDAPEKERRVSVPDILMSWNGTPQEDATTDDKRGKLPSYEEEVANFQSSTVVNEELLEAETVEADKEENGRIADPESGEEPGENSLNKSVKVCDVGLSTVNEPTLEEPSENTQTPSKRKKLNESIWSVESLPGFVPTKEWLAQNTTVGTEVIVELEETENGCTCDDERANQNDCVQMSESFISFSTPASKVTAEQASNTAGEPVVYKLQKFMNPLDSPIYVTCKESSNKVERKEASEPESSPNRKSFIVEENVDSNKDKTVLLEPEKGIEEVEVEVVEQVEESSQKVPEVEVERLLVPLQVVTEVSPSKVDFGVQWPEMQNDRGNQGMNRKHFHKSADFLNTSSRSEGYYGNGPKKRNFQYRNKDRPHSQQDMFHPYLDRPGKPRGGKGRY